MDNGFTMETKGQKSRALVSAELEASFAKVIGLKSKANSDTVFHDCMAWLFSHKDELSKNAKLASLDPHFAYYLKNLNERSIDPVAIWSTKGAKVEEDDMKWTQNYLPEFLSHITGGVLGWQTAETSAPVGAAQMISIYQQLLKRSEAQSSKRLRDNVPYTVVGLPSEANLNVLFPMFEQSLDVAGDICEFGCFRGVTSIKMAFLAKAAGTNKTVYAFDTFEGFQISDPGGGALGVGAFSDHFDAYGELTKWGHVLPIVPVKGDATKTCEIIKAPLSFIWLDLDMGVLMDPVLNKIWPHITKDTIIGIDDVGRPETPTVEPWVDEVVRAGRLVEISRHPNEFIRFYKRG
jgi:Macrocin-O-methyltransferase (TylF)